LVIRRSLILAASLALGLSAASASPIFLRGGSPSGGATGSASACDGASTGVCADFADGQTFVQWPDVLNTGVTDYTKRYRVYRSTAALNSGNCTSGTLIGKYHLPNSGQLIGGNPDNFGGSTYTQANRQANNSSNPMAKIPDAATGGGALKQLAYATGLQVYKVAATQSAYYCVVSTNTTDASPSYIGAVGPIAESTATQQAVLYAHRSAGQGAVTGATTGLPIVLYMQGSASSGGAPPNSPLGDCWSWFGDTSESWQAGQQRTFCTYKDQNGTNSYPSLSGGSLVLNVVDEMWNTLGTGSLVSDYFGLGLTPLSGTANKFYPTTQRALEHQLTWLGAHYGADLNKIHTTGISAGAVGQALIGPHMSPRPASAWMSHPLLRWDLYPNGASLGSAWGGVFWTGTVASPNPFAATVHDGPAILGTVASALQFADGSSWLNYVNFPTAVQANPGDDMPFFGIQIAKDDTNMAASGPQSFAQDIEAINALQAAHRGHALTFFVGGHDTGFSNMGAINCDWSGAIAGVCYNKSQFALNLPYIATSSSSIDDNMGTATRDAAGILDGDSIGCINCGFTWTVTTDTSGAFNFTLGNTWMARSPTTIPATTISGSMTNVATVVALTSATFGGNVLNVGANPYFKIGSGATAEIVTASSISGGNLNIVSRGQFGSTAQAHSASDPIIQYPAEPTGPNGGPYASMTVNVTPRRVQSFIKSDGYVVSCTVTPFGGSPVTKTGTVASGLFPLSGITINSGGTTSLACS
jgi:hypothetical protein